MPQFIFEKLKSNSVKLLLFILASGVWSVVFKCDAKASEYKFPSPVMESLDNLTLLTEEKLEILGEAIGYSVDSIEEEAKEKYENTKWNDEFNKTDLKYLSCIVYCEANNMSRTGKIAVANVVLNRMRDTKDWGHVTTIKEVIYDQKWGTQFSPIIDGSMKRALKIYKSMDSGEWKDWQIESMEDSIAAAKQAMRGKTVVPDDYMYFNGYVSSTKKKCMDKGKSFRIVGAHIYY